MNDNMLNPKYKQCISEYGKLVADVRKICPAPSDCDYLISDDDIMEFMYALKALGQPLAAMQEFDCFNWNDLSEFMSEHEFLEYKAWYFTFYDEWKEKGGMDEALDALDKNTKIIRSNKIDKAFIISMLERVVRSNDDDDKKMKIELIKYEIDLTDNTQMRHKAPVMKEFISLRLPNLAPDADIEKEYDEFEKEAFEKRIMEFSEKNDLNDELLRAILKEYFASKQSITKITLYERFFNKELPPIKRTTTINRILTFIGDMYNKFKQYA